MLMFFLDDTGEYNRGAIFGGGGGSAATSAHSVRGGVSMGEVLARVREIAELSPTELSTAMGTEKGSAVARFKTEDVQPEALLRSWDRIGRASPQALTEEQYDRFLAGEHPTADSAELYGAHLGNK